MKAIELAQWLLEHPDFEVKGSFSEIDENGFNLTRFKTFKGDIGHSDKVIFIHLEMEE